MSGTRFFIFTFLLIEIAFKTFALSVSILLLLRALQARPLSPFPRASGALDYQSSEACTVCLDVSYNCLSAVNTSVVLHFPPYPCINYDCRVLMNVFPYTYYAIHG